jgi:hypothetical protein
MRQPIPLRLDIDRVRDAAVSTVVRECIAHAHRALGERVIRGATAPTTTTTTAPGLVQTTAAFLSTLVPFSAAADLLERALTLRFDGAGAIGVPAIGLGTAGFVGESAPIPVRQNTTSPGPVLRP